MAKLKAVKRERFYESMQTAAEMAEAYAMEELGWRRARAVAGVQDPDDPDIFLLRVEVGETDNPDHDTRTLALVVNCGTVTDEGEDDLWHDNVVAEV